MRTSSSHRNVTCSRRDIAEKLLIFCQTTLTVWMHLGNSIKTEYTYTSKMTATSECRLRTNLYDKRDDFNFPIVNFPRLAVTGYLYHK